MYTSVLIYVLKKDTCLRDEDTPGKKNVKQIYVLWGPFLQKKSSILGKC